MSIASVTTREQAFDLLEGYSSARRDELAQGGPISAGLVKSYMLETVPRAKLEPDIGTVFARNNARVEQIDDTLWKVWANDYVDHQADSGGGGRAGKWNGFVEQLVERHPVFYTTERAQQIEPWVRRLVNANQSVDNVWLSGVAFYQLWLRVTDLNDNSRFGQIGFEHESIYEIDQGAVRTFDEESEDPKTEVDGLEIGHSSDLSGDWSPEERGRPERRTSRFMMIDRLGRMKEALEKMRPIYDPLQSISMLRIPAIDRGGHDFYANGKVTNRSESFIEHRAHLRHVLQFYKTATEQTEETAWMNVEEQAIPGARPILGAPVVIKFLDASGTPDPLEQQLFEQWIETTFSRKNNRFRLWGRPIKLGPGKVHVYGADRHLWQPIFLEITRRHVVAILPKGTCGNTIHRLVTNVQRFICPNISVHIGEMSFSDVIGRAARGAVFQ